MDLSAILNELGEDREHYYNAIAPPILQTSNFAFRTVEELREALRDEMGGYLYSRGLNPTVEILRKKLAALDGAEECLLFNSGSAAVFAAVIASVRSGGHIVSVRAPYSWTQRLFDIILPRFNVATTYVDGTRVENWASAIQDTTTLFYLESPNSWDFSLQDIEAVAALARSRGIVTVCDNSYCTPIYQSPIALGVDLALQTATKYIGGHSDTLGGVLCGSIARLRSIFASEFLTIGSGIQPFNAWLLLRGLRTLPIRLERIRRTTMEVLGFLKNHPKIEQVVFPFDPDFPQYDLAQRQMRGACGLMTLIPKTHRQEEIAAFCQSLRHIRMAVSWGGHESLVMPKCAGMPPEAFDPNVRSHRMVRLYCGLEEPAYLIADLEKALAAIP